jgi:hypothetical protein
MAVQIQSWRESRTSIEHIAGTTRLQEQLTSKLEARRREPQSTANTRATAIIAEKHAAIRALRVQDISLEGDASAERAAILRQIETLQTEIAALSTSGATDLDLLHEAISVRHQRWPEVCRDEQRRQAEQIAETFDAIMPKTLKLARELMAALAEVEALLSLSIDLGPETQCPGYRALVPQARCVPPPPPSHVLRRWVGQLIELGW